MDIIAGFDVVMGTLYPDTMQFSDYVIYADESGDHSLKSVDPDYPIFVLTFCIFRKDDYARIVSPAIQELKFQHFGHDLVVLHEHGIRKRHPPFQLLAPTKNGAKRSSRNSVESLRRLLSPLLLR